MTEVVSSVVHEVLGRRAQDVDQPIIDYIINVLADDEFDFGADGEGAFDAIGELLVAAECVEDLDECRSVCSILCEKFGKHGLVKSTPTVRSLATPFRMNDGMDEEQVRKKKPELMEGPLLSERDRRKQAREKRHEERKREVLADNMRMPCRLVKGSHYTGVEDDAVNIIKLKDEREFLVDLMAAPGTLIPADILSANEATFYPYNPKINKIVSLHSSNDSGVAYIRPKPSLGEGSSKDSGAESSLPLDKRRHSENAESKLLFLHASGDATGGSSIARIGPGSYGEVYHADLKGTELPMDMVEFVLSFLPAKSLVRFQSLSHMTCSMIDSEFFIRHHLQNSIRMRFNRYIVLATYNNLFYVHLDPIGSAIELLHRLTCHVPSLLRVLCSIDGILCIAFHFGDGQNRGPQLIMWNLSINWHKILPVIYPTFFNWQACFGLGYDLVNKDYKLVRILPARNRGFGCKVKIVI